MNHRTVIINVIKSIMEENLNELDELEIVGLTTLATVNDDNPKSLEM